MKQKKRRPRNRNRKSKTELPKIKENLNCPNCLQTMDGYYCGNCGQSKKEMQQPFWKIVATFIGEALSLDGKFYHTLKLLIVKPWKLTQDFMNGKRICYTPPFRMYLFATFFAFLLLSANYSKKVNNATVNKIVVDTIKADTLITDSLKKESNISRFIDDVARGYNDADTVAKEKQKADSIKNNAKLPNEAETEKRDNHFSKVLRNISQFADSQPQLFIDTVLKKVSQALLILFPLFALLLSILYYAKKRYLLEHLLLSLNFHTFIFIVVIVSTLMLLTSIDFIKTFAGFVYLLIPIQLYRTIRNYYQQKRAVTVVKFIILSGLYIFLLLFVLFVSFGLVLYNFW